MNMWPGVHHTQDRVKCVEEITEELNHTAFLQIRENI